MFNPRATIVRSISPEHPEAPVIAEAVAVLRRGGLVAFPTETVYGLGANALDAAAVESIFSAKGRPPTNPVIVHVADVAAAQRLVSEWPKTAARLAAAFWPGSLTLVLPKRPEVPSVVTAGGPTVGVRVPAHPVALALLQAVELPVAAPSANRATRISPTTAEHVRRGLDGRIDFILDAGPTPGGLESTVLDLTFDPPRLLRPGLVTVAQLEGVIGRISIEYGHRHQPPSSEPIRSPGMLQRHYSPRAKVVCISGRSETAVQELLATVTRVGWLRFGIAVTSPVSGAAPNATRDVRSSTVSDPTDVKVIDMPHDSSAYAARLYSALHEMDEAGVDTIVVDAPPVEAAWLAIHDRLQRAAAQQ